MNFRVLWEAFGRPRVWNNFCRLKGFSRANPFIRSTVGVTKYPRAAFILSLTGVYNAANTKHHQHAPKDCKIDDSYLQELSKELKELERLKCATLICKKCNQRLLVDKPVEGKVYCKCDTNVALTDETTGWQPFLESKDIIIWRREEIPGSGLYEYKVYGKYEEVTAEDFLSMHTDLTYWRSWDDTALTIKKLPQPPNFNLKQNQEIIYWETLWPRFFSNRDYVYVRRHAYMEVDTKGTEKIINVNDTQCDTSFEHCVTVSKSHTMSKKRHGHDKYSNEVEQDTRSKAENVRNATEIGNFMKSNLFQDGFYKRSATKIIVLTSQSCEHPDAPETNKAHRVKRYRSDLVIKPLTDLDKPGIEFSLTYFDDPGTSIPSALQSWVAGHACPDFLLKMRLAAGNYRKSSQNTTVKKVQETSPKNITVEQPAVMNNNGSLLFITKEHHSKAMDHSDILIVQNDKVSSRGESPEGLKTKEINQYKEKTKRDTEELLELLNGNSKSTENNAKVIKNTNKVEEEKNKTNSKLGDKESTENKDKKTKTEERTLKKTEDTKKDTIKEGQDQEKQKDTNHKSMSYWQIWPLYYFA